MEVARLLLKMRLQYVRTIPDGTLVPSGSRRNHQGEGYVGQLRTDSSGLRHAEPGNVDAESAEPQDVAQDLGVEELDVRERIYDMVRPLNWMEEASEPPGIASDPISRLVIADGTPYRQ